MKRLRYNSNGANPVQHPILYALLQEKVVWIEQDEYLGKASDQRTVALGTVGFENTCEAYLKNNSTADCW